MFIGSYDFAGDDTSLLAAYDRMMAEYPADALLVHLCVRTDTGITIYDACPSREVFDAFSHSAEFAEALARAGLPTPRITSLGDVRAARVREAVA